MQKLFLFFIFIQLVLLQKEKEKEEYQIFQQNLFLSKNDYLKVNIFDFLKKQSQVMDLQTQNEDLIISNQKNNMQSKFNLKKENLYLKQWDDILIIKDYFFIVHDNRNKISLIKINQVDNTLKEIPIDYLNANLKILQFQSVTNTHKWKDYIEDQKKETDGKKEENQDDKENKKIFYKFKQFKNQKEYNTKYQKYKQLMISQSIENAKKEFDEYINYFIAMKQEINSIYFNFQISNLHKINNSNIAFTITNQQKQSTYADRSQGNELSILLIIFNIDEMQFTQYQPISVQDLNSQLQDIDFVLVKRNQIYPMDYKDNEYYDYETIFNQIDYIDEFINVYSLTFFQNYDYNQQSQFQEYNIFKLNVVFLKQMNKFIILDNLNLQFLIQVIMNFQKFRQTIPWKYKGQIIEKQDFQQLKIECIYYITQLLFYGEQKQQKGKEEQEQNQFFEMYRSFVYKYGTYYYNIFKNENEMEKSEQLLQKNTKQNYYNLILYYFNKDEQLEDERYDGFEKCKQIDNQYSNQVHYLQFLQYYLLQINQIDKKDNFKQEFEFSENNPTIVLKHTFNINQKFEEFNKSILLKQVQSIPYEQKSKRTTNYKRKEFKQQVQKYLIKTEMLVDDTIQQKYFLCQYQLNTIMFENLKNLQEASNDDKKVLEDITCKHYFNDQKLHIIDYKIHGNTLYIQDQKKQRYFCRYQDKLAILVGQNDDSLNKHLLMHGCRVIDNLKTEEVQFILQTDDYFVLILRQNKIIYYYVIDVIKDLNYKLIDSKVISNQYSAFTYKKDDEVQGLFLITAIDNQIKIQDILIKNYLTFDFKSIYNYQLTQIHSLNELLFKFNLQIWNYDSIVQSNVNEIKQVQLNQNYFYKRRFDIYGNGLFFDYRFFNYGLNEQKQNLMNIKQQNIFYFNPISIKLSSQILIEIPPDFTYWIFGDLFITESGIFTYEQTFNNAKGSLFVKIKLLKDYYTYINDEDKLNKQNESEIYPFNPYKVQQSLMEFQKIKQELDYEASDSNLLADHISKIKNILFDIILQTERDKDFFQQLHEILFGEKAIETISDREKIEIISQYINTKYNYIEKHSKVLFVKKVGRYYVVFASNQLGKLFAYVYDIPSTVFIQKYQIDLDQMQKEMLNQHYQKNLVKRSLEENSSINDKTEQGNENLEELKEKTQYICYVNDELKLICYVKIYPLLKNNSQQQEQIKDSNDNQNESNVQMNEEKYIYLDNQDEEYENLQIGKFVGSVNLNIFIQFLELQYQHNVQIEKQQQYQEDFKNKWNNFNNKQKNNKKDNKNQNEESNNNYNSQYKGIEYVKSFLEAEMFPQQLKVQKYKMNFDMNIESPNQTSIKIQNNYKYEKKKKDYVDKIIYYNMNDNAWRKITFLKKLEQFTGNQQKSIEKMLNNIETKNECTTTDCHLMIQYPIIVQYYTKNKFQLILHTPFSYSEFNSFDINQFYGLWYNDSFRIIVACFQLKKNSKNYFAVFKLTNNSIKQLIYMGELPIIFQYMTCDFYAINGLTLAIIIRDEDTNYLLGAYTYYLNGPFFIEQNLNAKINVIETNPNQNLEKSSFQLYSQNLQDQIINSLQQAKKDIQIPIKNIVTKKVINLREVYGILGHIEKIEEDKNQVDYKNQTISKNIIQFKLNELEPIEQQISILTKHAKFHLTKKKYLIYQNKYKHQMELYMIDKKQLFFIPLFTSESSCNKIDYLESEDLIICITENSDEIIVQRNSELFQFTSDDKSFLSQYQQKARKLDEIRDKNLNNLITRKNLQFLDEQSDLHQNQLEQNVQADQLKQFQQKIQEFKKKQQNQEDVDQVQKLFNDQQKDYNNEKNILVRKLLEQHYQSNEKKLQKIIQEDYIGKTYNLKMRVKDIQVVDFFKTKLNKSKNKITQIFGFGSNDGKNILRFFIQSENNYFQEFGYEEEQELIQKLDNSVYSKSYDQYYAISSEAFYQTNLRIKNLTKFYYKKQQRLYIVFLDEFSNQIKILYFVLIKNSYGQLKLLQVSTINNSLSIKGTNETIEQIKCYQNESASKSDSLFNIKCVVLLSTYIHIVNIKELSRFGNTQQKVFVMEDNMNDQLHNINYQLDLYSSFKGQIFYSQVGKQLYLIDQKEQDHQKIYLYLLDNKKKILNKYVYGVYEFKQGENFIAGFLNENDKENIYLDLVKFQPKLTRIFSFAGLFYQQLGYQDYQITIQNINFGDSLFLTYNFKVKFFSGDQQTLQITLKKDQIDLYKENKYKIKLLLRTYSFLVYSIVLIFFLIMVTLLIFAIYLYQNVNFLDSQLKKIKDKESNKRMIGEPDESKSSSSEENEQLVFNKQNDSLQDSDDDQEDYDEDLNAQGQQQKKDSLQINNSLKESRNQNQAEKQKESDKSLEEVNKEDEKPPDENKSNKSKSKKSEQNK